MQQSNHQFSIQEYLDVFKKYRVWIVLFTILMAGVLGILKYVTYQPEYTAQTSILVTSIPDGTSSKTSTDYNVNNNVLMTFSEVIKSETLKSRVQEELQVTDLGNISVSSTAGSVIRINVNHSDAVMAAMIANTTGQVFKDMIQGMMSDISLSTLDQAGIPQYTAGMGLAKSIIIGAVIGLGLSIGVVLLLDLLDNTLKLPKDIQKEMDISILGVIPDVQPELKKHLKGKGV